RGFQPFGLGVTDTLACSPPAPDGFPTGLRFFSRRVLPTIRSNSPRFFSGGRHDYYRPRCCIAPGAGALPRHELPPVLAALLRRRPRRPQHGPATGAAPRRETDQ